MSVTLPICTKCKLLKYEQIGEGRECRYWCDAFPDGIPLDFMFRKNPDISEECNNGIGYEPKRA